MEFEELLLFFFIYVYFGNIMGTISDMIPNGRRFKVSFGVMDWKKLVSLGYREYCMKYMNPSWIFVSGFCINSYFKK